MTAVTVALDWTPNTNHAGDLVKACQMQIAAQSSALRVVPAWPMNVRIHRQPDQLQDST